MPREEIQITVTTGTNHYGSNSVYYGFIAIMAIIITASTIGAGYLISILNK